MERLRKESEAEGIPTTKIETKAPKYIPTTTQLFTDWWGVLAGRFSFSSYVRNGNEGLKASWRQGGEQGRQISNQADEALRDPGVQMMLSMLGPEMELLTSEEQISITVGRWMSKLELTEMLETGLVQESRLNGVTSVTYPANPNAYLNAKPGSVYVQFDVLKSVLRGSDGSTAKIYGPNSMFGPLLNISRMPQAKNIVPIMSKILRK